MGSLVFACLICDGFVIIMHIMVTINIVVVFSTFYCAKAVCIKEMDTWLKKKPVSNKHRLCSGIEANKQRVVHSLKFYGTVLCLFKEEPLDPLQHQ